MNTHLQPLREVKENLGRTKSYLNRHEPLKGIASVCEALKIMLHNKFYGTDRIEIEVLLTEVVQMLNTTTVLSKYIPKNLDYQKGQEKQLYKDLVHLIQKIAEDMQNESSQKQQSEEEQEELRKQRLLNKLQEFLSSQDKVKTAGNIKKLVEHYGDQPELYTEIADRYYKTGYYKEALSYVQKALQKDNQDLRAYKVAVNAFRFLKQHDKAIQFFKKALNAFGEHANLYMNLSRLYLECEKHEHALQSANKALQLEPDNAEIQELIKEIRQSENISTEYE